MTASTTTGHDKPRRTRYRRDTPPAMRLTDDDVAIIRHVWRHRFLRSTHVIRLMGDRSAKKIIEPSAFMRAAALRAWPGCTRSSFVEV